MPARYSRAELWKSQAYSRGNANVHPLFGTTDRCDSAKGAGGARRNRRGRAVGENDGNHAAERELADLSKHPADADLSSSVFAAESGARGEAACLGGHAPGDG